MRELYRELREAPSDELRVRAARLHGWKYEGHGHWITPDGTKDQALYPTGNAYDTVVGMGKWEQEVPDDYPNDLDAIHAAVTQAAETVPSFVSDYRHELQAVVLDDTCTDAERSSGCDGWHLLSRGIVPDLFEYANATAKQRTIAYILAMERR